MRTRAKMQIVASDRARRENVPRHILFYNGRFLRNSILHKNIVKSNEQNGAGITCIISAYSAYNVSKKPARKRSVYHEIREAEDHLLRYGSGI